MKTEKSLLKISTKNQKILQRNLETLYHNIQKAVSAASRDLNEIVLLPVTKYKDISYIEELKRLGFSSFGESRVLEMKEKSEALKEHQITWHLIGPLQSNKVVNLKDINVVIHSVDREKILDKLFALEKQQKIFFQVNVSKEKSKQGFCVEGVFNAVEKALELGCFDIQGLMTMTPKDSSSRDRRGYFSELREIKVKLEAAFNITLEHLSMGMSSDYEEAILEGSTYIRIGSAIFKGLV